MIDQERIEAMERRCAAATAGKWFINQANSYGTEMSTRKHSLGWLYGEYPQTEKDCEFICEARADLPDLLAERAELLAEVEEMRGQVKAEDALRAEVARLREVVDRLPRTADGVPVVQGDTIWEPVTYTYANGKPVGALGCEFLCMQGGKWVVHEYGPAQDGPFYSSREAALAAKDGGK